MTNSALLEKINIWARELGFQQIGVSDIDVTEHAQHLQHWLEKNYDQRNAQEAV